MKKVVSILVVALMLIGTTTHASVIIPDGMYRVRCTCYLPTGNKTATGCTPYAGIIAASSDHLWDVAALYTENLEFIGFFECRDTGGSAISSGKRIDVFCENWLAMHDWISTYGDYVIVQWIECEG